MKSSRSPIEDSTDVTSSVGQLSTQQQSAGDIGVSGEKNTINLVTSAGRTAIDQSHHVVYNYYYQKETELLAIQKDEYEPDDALPCPYRGLFHFGPDDAEYFFGRSEFILELEGIIETQAFVPVLGASGSGKSSVVLAGLVPRLQSTGQWLFTHFRPGADPFNAIAQALAPLYLKDCDETKQMAQGKDLARYLKNGTLELSDIINRIKQNNPAHRVLLIADQFEELHTLCTDDDTRQKFLRCLLGELGDNSTQTLGSMQYGSPMVIVATMRADFLGSALSYPALAKVLQNDIKLGPMTSSELQEVIEQPAAKLDVKFEAGLVARILEDVKAEPGNLPLLEFALTELWKKRKGKTLTHAAYDATGEVEGALARYADEQFSRLSESEQAQVRSIFVQLVQPGAGTLDTRRIATKTELGAKRWRFVKKLADTRLVVTSQNETKQETVEVVHEALIRHWGELRAWMDTDREFRAWQERLRGSLQQWEATTHDEGALLRGAALVEARERLKERREDLGSAEREFVKASVDLQRQEKKQKIDAERRKLRQARYWTSALSLIALIAVGVGRWAYFEKSQAQQAKVRAEIASESSTMKSLLESGFAKEAVTQAMKTGERLQEGEVNDSNNKKRFLALASIQATIPDAKEEKTLDAHTDDVYVVAFSPDGQKIATAGQDGTLRLWSKEGSELVETDVGDSGAITSIAFSPDKESPLIAFASKDNKVRLWDTSSNKVIGKFEGHNEDVQSVAFSPDGKMLATASDDDTIKLWDVKSRKSKDVVLQHSADVMSVDFNPEDPRMLASASDDGTVRLWNIEGKNFKTLTHKETEEAKFVYDVAFSPDGKTLASAGWDGTAKVWDRTTGQLLTTFTGHEDYVVSVAFSEDGSKLATGSYDSTIKLWDTSEKGENEAALQTYRGHRDYVHGVALNDGVLASASEDNTVKLWTVESSTLTLDAHDKAVEDIAFNPADNTMFASAGGDGVMIWRKGENEPTQVLEDHSRTVYSVAFSRDGKTIAIVGEDRTVKLWSLSEKKFSRIRDDAHTGNIYGVDFHPTNSEVYVTASGDKTVKLWNVNQDLATHTFEESSEEVYRAIFSPDGNKIATAGVGGTVMVWDSNSHELLADFSAHEENVNDLAFSQDRHLMATASRDKTVKIWNLNNRSEPPITLRGHKDPVWSVAFSSDSQTVVTGDADGTVKLWNVNGEELQTLSGHQSVVTSVAFGLDGETIVTASGDSNIREWNFNLNDLMDKGCEWLESYFVGESPELLIELKHCQQLKGFTEKTAEALIEKGEDKARRGSLEEAKVLWSKAIEWGRELDFDPEQKAEDLKAAQDRVDEGVRVAKKGKIDEALDAFRYAENLDSATISAREWRDLCWYGAKHGKNELVMDACQKAIAFEPVTLFDKRSRGIAHALIGKKKRAINDLSLFVEGTSKDDSQRKETEAWIDQLKKGENPFTSTVLISLEK